jgi:hypothetical protein
VYMAALARRAMVPLHKAPWLVYQRSYMNTLHYTVHISQSYRDSAMGFQFFTARLALAQTELHEPMKEGMSR